MSFLAGYGDLQWGRLRQVQYGLGRLLTVAFVLTAAISGNGQESANQQHVMTGTQPVHGIARAVLQPFVDAHVLAGAVTLVATKDKVLDVEAVGFADLKTRKAMQTNDMFWIASMTKPMTAAAIMMLVDEGKISLDDPVEKYLPEFKGQMVLSQSPDTKNEQGKSAQAATPEPAKHPILIREILSHTSGLPFSSKKEPGALDLLPLNEAVRNYAAEPLIFQPGTSFEYSNEGVNTAARILEVVTGMPYAEFMQQRLFEPLGMKDTTFWPNHEQISRLAKTYKASADKTRLEETPIEQLTYPLDDSKHRYVVPAGGLFSTAGDVVKFCQMILDGGTYHGKRLLSRSAVMEMTSKQTKTADSYGLGWYVGDGTISHPGVYKTNMTIDLQHGIITIFLVQQAGPWRTDEGKRMLRTFTDSMENSLLQSSL